MATKEPSAPALYAARLARAYPSLSSYSAASLAHELHAIERAQHRHAERLRCNNGEDGGYVKREPIVATASAHAGIPRGYRAVHDPEAEARAGGRILRRMDAWKCRILDLQSHARCRGSDGLLEPPVYLPTVYLQDDPRGRVLLLQLPGEAAPA